MREQEAAGADLAPIRGNNLGIVSECTRLKDLADHLESTGRSILSLRSDSWTGRARDHFDDAQFAMGKNWLRAADSHYKAAAMLGEYRIALENVQLLSDSAIADARKSGFAPAAVENTTLLIARWRHQLDEVGQKAAMAIRAAGEDLVGLRRVLREPDPAISHSPSVRPAAAPQSDAEPRRVNEADLPNPYDAFADVSAYRQSLSVLNAAVLDSWRA